jgi:hypothetical protein
MAVTRLRKQPMAAGRFSKPPAYIAAAASGVGELARIIFATLGRNPLTLSHVAPAKCSAPFLGSSRMSMVTGASLDTLRDATRPSQIHPHSR